MTRAAQRSRASVLARGLLSLLGIVLIVVGLPVALVVLGGNPLPSEVPQTQEVIDALRDLGVTVEDEGRGTLPFVVHGTGSVRGGRVVLDASAAPGGGPADQ